MIDQDLARLILKAIAEAHQEETTDEEFDRVLANITTNLEGEEDEL